MELQGVDITIKTEIIYHPKTEKDVEVLVVILGEHPDWPTAKRPLKFYIDPYTRAILTRDMLDASWNMWAPLPFKKELHERLKENGYYFNGGLYTPDKNRKVNSIRSKKVVGPTKSLDSLSPEELEMLAKRAAKVTK